MSKKIIKFSASWCQPCKALAPKFEKISKMEEFKDFEFKTIDIEEDDDDNLVEKYQIRSVPTIVMVNEDNIVEKKIVGNVQESSLIDFIKGEEGEK